MYKNEANCETGEIVLVAYTDEEIAERETLAAQIALREQAAAQAKVDAETTKAALLERLGITEAEAKLLLS